MNCLQRGLTIPQQPDAYNEEDTECSPQSRRILFWSRQSRAAPIHSPKVLNMLARRCVGPGWGGCVRTGTISKSERGISRHLHPSRRRAGCEQRSTRSDAQWGSSGLYRTGNLLSMGVEPKRSGPSFLSLAGSCIPTVAYWLNCLSMPQPWYGSVLVVCSGQGSPALSFEDVRS